MRKTRVIKNILERNDLVMISKTANCAKRYQGRLALVKYHFNDDRVLVFAPDRKSPLGLKVSEVTFTN
jgi:hypothetical protein